jgi:formate hydrogenlyase regulatory protein HycA
MHYLSITSADGQPLGTRDEVVAHISAALPGLRWAKGPSSFDELNSIPNHPFLQLPWSDEQRAVFSLPKLTGTYDGENFGLEIRGLESCPLTTFPVTVSGEGNPLPALRKVCQPEWALVDEAGESLDLNADASSEWAASRQRVAAKKKVVFGPPERLRVPHDDHRFEHVGHYGNGNQFMAFVSGAFPADWWAGNRSPEYLQTRWAEHKRWYAVLHRFDAAGNHLGTDAWSGGTTEEGQDEACERAWRKLGEMLSSLGRRRPGDIKVKPFRFEHDGYLFSLRYERNSYEDPDDPEAGYECVMLWPNDIMFHPPWDSGEYST